MGTDWRRLGDIAWFLVWAAASSAWCLTAAAYLGPTFDEPLYVNHGLNNWRQSTKQGLLHYGTMPLPIDVQTLPLYLWEQASGATIDPVADLQRILWYCRAMTLLFWWLLLWYARLAGRALAGPWAGRLAVALLACEPSLLAHASLATTDIAVTACLLALFYHFHSGREANWLRRIAIPAVWYGLAILAKASALVYAPICLVVIELERLTRSGAFAQAAPPGWRGRLAYAWKQTEAGRRDLLRIGLGGLALAFLYCGCDFQPQPSFVAWARELPEGPLATAMVWFSEHLCIFSNAGEGLIRQIKHNMHGHGTYLLGADSLRSLWFYFPVLLSIKLSVPLLVAPFGVALMRARALANWACLTALVLLLASLNFRVQIGIRLVLPLVAIAIVGLAAALVEVGRTSRWRWVRPVLAGALTLSLAWTAASAANIWPHGLCYINELWGGTARGYRLVSDSNYDWGQGLPELLAWREAHDNPPMDVWYFGSDPSFESTGLRYVPVQDLNINSPAELVGVLQARYFAVGTTMAYGPTKPQSSSRMAAEFMRGRRPVARTTTFLIYDRHQLTSAACVGNIARVPGGEKRGAP
jgi:hypothetical protein